MQVGQSQFIFQGEKANKKLTSTLSENQQRLVEFSSLENLVDGSLRDVNFSELSRLLAKDDLKPSGGMDNVLSVMRSLLDRVTSLVRSSEDSEINELEIDELEEDERVDEEMEIEPEEASEEIENKAEIENPITTESTAVEIVEDSELESVENESALKMAMIREQEVASFAHHLGLERKDENYDKDYDFDHDGDIDEADLVKFAKERQSDEALIKKGIEQHFGTSLKKQGEDFASHLDLNQDGKINFQDFSLGKDLVKKVKGKKSKEKTQDVEETKAETKPTTLEAAKIKREAQERESETELIGTDSVAIDDIRDGELAAFSRHFGSTREEAHYNSYYDVDHDGDVDGKDLARFSKEQKSDESLVKNAMKRHFGTTLKEQGESFVSHLDLNQDGRINFQDLALSKQWIETTKKELKSETSTENKSKSQEISSTEVDDFPHLTKPKEEASITINRIREEESKAFQKHFGPASGDKKADKQYDLNKDGLINEDDFTRFQKKNHSDQTLIKSAIRHHFGTTLKEQGEAFASHMDLNQDGRINFQDLALSKEL